MTDPGIASSSDVNAFPRVVPVGTRVELSVVAQGAKPALAPNRTYEVRFFSKVDREDDTRIDLRTDGRCALRVPALFRECGEYTLEVRSVEELLLSEAFYAAGRDLARLRPFKGDVHMHTTGSDGRNTTREMLSRARELGMDFAAITDHDNFEPSCLAVPEADALGAGLLVIKGEEIAIRGIGGHILSLNAGEPVGGRRRWTPETEKEYAAIAGGLAGRPLISPLTAESYSMAVWTATRIRDAGGLAVMAHPYWEGSKGKYYPPRCVFEQLLADDLIDGVELIGGSPLTEGNLLAVAKYTEEAAKGRRMAIVGGSDAHSSEELGRKYTIVFAEKLAVPDDATGAIAGRRSVACDTQLGPTVAMFGPFELVEYAYFLQRVYFPVHDDVCSAFAGPDPVRLRKELEEFGELFWHR